MRQLLKNSIATITALLASWPQMLPAASQELAKTITQAPGSNAVGNLGEAASLLAAIFKVIGALGVVVVLMMIVIYFLKKAGLSQGGFHKNSLIKVLESKMVAPKKYIAIVDIAGKTVAVGISDNNINMLTALENLEEHALSEDASSLGGSNQTGMPQNFAQSLSNAVSRFTQKLNSPSSLKESHK